MNGTATRSAPRQLYRHFGRTAHAPFRLLQRSAQRSLHVRPTPPSFLRKHLANTPSVANQLRRESTVSAPKPLTDRSESLEQQQAEEIAARKAQEPAYELTFTCKKCSERSTHRVTKQAYHHGTCLITCPGCKNRHLISDHLKIFSDKNITLEDIMKEKGQLLRKGRLGTDGDIEFYDDQVSQ